jgi:dienelactone hydrolase
LSSFLAFCAESDIRLKPSGSAIGTFTRRLLACLAMLCLAWPAAYAQDDDTSGPLLPGVTTNERVMSVPGDPYRPVALEVTVLTPPGPGRFPLVIANHGADEASSNSRGSRYRRTFLAFYFLSRGYAVVLPMMRGFSGSGGEIALHGCDVAQVARDNAKDISAVIDYMGVQPDIDASRVVVIGQSFGGWNTLALGADPPRNLVGLINFNGGMRTSGCDDTGPGLIAGASDFGLRTRTPSIWFYGDNDALFPTSLWRSMYQHYISGGANSQLVDIGRFGTDSHKFLNFPETLALWTPPLDEFLGRIGMPNQPLHSEYLPKPWPKPTGFAAVDDVAAVPYLNDAARELYRKYLRQPMPKAFLIAPGGEMRGQYGGFDPVGQGLANCRQNKAICRVYAIDDQVVWTALPPRPPSTGYALLADVSAVPYVSDAGRDLYRQFLAKYGPRALVLAPNGSAYAHYGPDAFAAAWLSCQDASSICEPYAIDNDVVWTPPSPLPTASHFAELQNVYAVPYLKPEGRQGYLAFLNDPKPRAFVIAPDGGWASAHGNTQIARYALAACSKQHQGCGIYAINDAVVWR